MISSVSIPPASGNYPERIGRGERRAVHDLE